MSRPFPPRPGDRPREEIVRMASEAIAQNGGPGVSEVYFKFTCPHCGERCTFDEPNQLFEEGECCGCGTKSRVEVAGFILRVCLGGEES